MKTCAALLIATIGFSYLWFTGTVEAVTVVAGKDAECPLSAAIAK